MVHGGHHLLAIGVEMAQRFFEQFIGVLFIFDVRPEVVAQPMEFLAEGAQQRIQVAKFGLTGPVAGFERVRRLRHLLAHLLQRALERVQMFWYGVQFLFRCHKVASGLALPRHPGLLQEDREQQKEKRDGAHAQEGRTPQD